MKIIIIENATPKIKGLLERYFISIGLFLYVNNNIGSKLFDEIKDYIRKQSNRKTKSIFIEDDSQEETRIKVEYFNFKNISLSNNDLLMLPCLISTY
jgi:hypothetical protein